MSTSHIEPKNLKLVPHAPEHLRALIQENQTSMHGALAGSQPMEFIVSKDVSPDWLARLEVATAADPWTHGFGLVHVASGTVIGCGGFKGPPGADGVVRTPRRGSEPSAGSDRSERSLTLKTDWYGDRNRNKKNESGTEQPDAVSPTG